MPNFVVLGCLEVGKKFSGGGLVVGVGAFRHIVVVCCIYPLTSILPCQDVVNYIFGTHHGNKKC